MNQDAKGVSIRINVGALESKPSFFKTTNILAPDQEIDISCQQTGLPKAKEWYALEQQLISLHGSRNM